MAFTCMKPASPAADIVQLCQTFVSAGVGRGDTVSDVFQLAGGQREAGRVLWGGTRPAPSRFSPFGDVTRPGRSSRTEPSTQHYPASSDTGGTAAPVRRASASRFTVANAGRYSMAMGVRSSST